MNIKNCNYFTFISIFIINRDNIEEPSNIKVKNLDNNFFLPMNFDLIMDYFKSKGKQRESIIKIKDAIEFMTLILKDFEDNKRYFNNEKHYLSKKHIKVNNNESNNLNENFRVHEELNFAPIYDEFKFLFNNKIKVSHDEASNIISNIFTKNTERKKFFSNLTQKAKVKISDIFHLKSKTVEKKEEIIFTKKNIELEQKTKSSSINFNKYKSFYSSLKDTNEKKIIYIDKLNSNENTRSTEFNFNTEKSRNVENNFSLVDASKSGASFDFCNNNKFSFNTTSIKTKNYVKSFYDKEESNKSRLFKSTNKLNDCYENFPTYESSYKIKKKIHKYILPIIKKTENKDYLPNSLREELRP